MPIWISCPQLDGNPIRLNMSKAKFVTEETGNLAAVCFGSGERDRIPVQDSKDQLAAMIAETKEVRPAKPPRVRSVIY
ncbi:MAG TPA: hypothetical protein VGM17_14010 [Rhizomicrobium sp.]|jgi:hypothetical protein